MRVFISTEALAAQGLTLKDFGVLLYYIDKGKGDIVPEIGKKLWDKNLLVKEVDGYSFNGCRSKAIQEWFEESKVTEKEAKRDFGALADKLRALYPEGRKPGTQYMWRDNTMTIAKKLKNLDDLCKEYGMPSFTDEQAIEATQRYVASFHGNLQYMQLLKYFILKQNYDKAEKASQLLSFIQNQQAGSDLEPELAFDEFGELV